METNELIFECSRLYFAFEKSMSQVFKAMLRAISKVKVEFEIRHLIFVKNEF